VLKEELEQDISRFFNDIEKMTDGDKKKTLLNLFDKYIHLSSVTVLFNKQDFERIKGNGIALYNDRAWPKKFNNSYLEISASEAPHMCWVEATIAYLNGKDCLKKLPKFDYKESK